jgi:signal transduction histidine kinase
MRDRVAAVGGRLAIVSSPGRGTRVSADIPLGGR